jgi:hypothetical protein
MALAHDDEGLRLVCQLIGKSDAALQNGILSGIGLLATRSKIDLTIQSKQVIAQITVEVISRNTDFIMLVRSVQCARKLVPDLDTTILRNLQDCHDELPLITMMRALDTNDDRSFRYIILESQGDVSETVRATALTCLCRRLNNDEAVSVLVQRLKLGSSVERTQVLGTLEIISRSEFATPAERQALRRLLDVLALSPEDSIREGAQRCMARVSDR